MPSVQAATVQMDVRPAATDTRLYRADQLIGEAVELGAELVVLPELFNTGYTYSDENFQRAETMDGATVKWMKRAAHRYGIHLAGSLLLADEGDIFNAMLLAAPDGRTWRYDKSYPWGWERGYFRGNRRQGAERAIVAQTDLGDLGMLVCWDAAHPDLWASYAGKVDLLLVSSCIPQITKPRYSLPPNIHFGAEQLGSLGVVLKDEEQRVFESMLSEQAAWLGVPVVHSTACGQFESAVPHGRATLMGMLPSAPGLIRYLARAHGLRVSTRMVDAGRIISATGYPLAKISQNHGEGIISAEVTLASEKPQPKSAQPPGRASKLSYFFSDNYLPRIMQSTYRRGGRRTP